ncbi:MAG: hypothetical protein FWG37_06525 [Clostridia bacterium]|nr:hypothetical protein [Clostridia bacterium]
MKFAIGYPLRQTATHFFLSVRDLLPSIAELYFPWPGAPSGRSALGEDGGFIDYTAFGRLEEDLFAFRDAGVKLDLLFNSNCYGEEAISVALKQQVVSVLSYMAGTVGLPEVVTTTSPAVAFILREEYPSVHVRASVNMRIGTVQGMSYVADLFDEYMIQRDINRDIAALGEVCAWAERNGKGVSILANSGCLRFCSGQTFHDNLVAHGTRVDHMRKMEDFDAHTCWRYLRGKSERFTAIMQATWIRPEDVHQYTPYVEVMKLATRMHPAPRAVLDAYAAGRWRGNLLDLLEPGFAPLFHPMILDNARIPDDWFPAVLRCDGQCQRCDVCERAMRAALVETRTAP